MLLPDIKCEHLATFIMDATGYSFRALEKDAQTALKHICSISTGPKIQVWIILVAIGLNVVLSTTMDNDVPRPICCPTKLVSPAQIPGAIGVTPETKHDQMLAVRSTLWSMRS